jgi:uncharacterized membrane protein
VVVLSAGLSLLLAGSMNETIVVVSLTLLGLAFSLIRPVRELSGAYETGQYIFLIFCVAAGVMVDLGTLLEGVPQLIGFMAVALFGAIGLHCLLAYLFKLDADTVLITSSAGIFGPPFIGPVANVMRNRQIVPSGMTIGVIGLALGNLIGLAVAWWWGS